MIETMFGMPDDLFTTVRWDYLFLQVLDEYEDESLSLFHFDPGHFAQAMLMSEGLNLIKL